jgi:hypothetical protein
VEAAGRHGAEPPGYAGGDPVSIHRIEAFLNQPLPPRPGFRRVRCKCDCGRWWYWSRSNPGRTPVYATPDCYNRWRRAGLYLLGALLGAVWPW